MRVAVLWLQARGNSWKMFEKCRKINEFVNVCACVCACKLVKRENV